MTVCSCQCSLLHGQSNDQNGLTSALTLYSWYQCGYLQNVVSNFHSVVDYCYQNRNIRVKHVISVCMSRIDYLFQVLSEQTIAKMLNKILVE